MAQTHCRHFSGYKPCGFSTECADSCPHRDIPSHRILLIHLGAMGAVLRSTALLPAIHRKYAKAHITWVTDKSAAPLLGNNPLIDRVVTTETPDLLSLQGRSFDIALIVDKSPVAAGLLGQLIVGEVYGFAVDPYTGAILPATDAAEELWELGLSNHKKFFINRKPETRLVCEALELPYQRDPYTLTLTDAEREDVRRRRALWSPLDRPIIGINTGCSAVIPYKKLSVEYQRRLIGHLSALDLPIVLLGGPEDAIRNKQIAGGLDVISSPVDRGVRDGLVSAAACDIVVTGDSLGMHMAIALEKWVVAWFGPTCAHEIDLYDRGVAVISQAPCGPCWRRSCHKETMCYDLVDIREILSGINQGLNWLRRSSTQPLSAISSSPSRSSSDYDPSREPNP